MPLYWIVIILILVLVYVIFLYNSLVLKRNRKEEAWSDIDVQLKRRYDLIPNLVKTVQGYAKHESGIFEKVTELRTKALETDGVREQGQAENMLTDALKSVFAVAENYPDLKASANFIELQKELTDTENKIQASRRFFNSTVQDLNTAIQSFPQNLFVERLGFSESDFFEIDEDEKEKAKNPTPVSF